jgi:hypothetical protein
MASRLERGLRLDSNPIARGGDHVFDDLVRGSIAVLPGIFEQLT